MSKEIPNPFEKLSLKYWYKYLLYLTGILLLAVLILGSSFDQNKIITYSISIMAISIFLWILDDIVLAIDGYYVEKTNNYNKSEYLEKAKSLVIIREIVHVICFVIWLIITFRTF